MMPPPLNDGGGAPFAHPLKPRLFGYIFSFPTWSVVPVCYTDLEMANSPRKGTGRTNTNDGKAQPVEEEKSLISKWQGDILRDPLSIKDNIKEEERNSLDIKW